MSFFRKSDIKWVEMDFETCVLTHHPECQFLQNSNAALYQRSQMGQFCGHDKVTFLTNFAIFIRNSLLYLDMLPI